MFKAQSNPFLVPFDNSFLYKHAHSAPGKKIKKSELKKDLAKEVDNLRELQRVLYAYNRYAVLLIFQAMDAAGKDSTIRAVMSGINPAGCQVFSFKRPSEEELDHDFLWRTTRCLPERGRIGVFNRSYYEEVLVVRVHQEFLDYQRLPYRPGPDELWQQRYESICDQEKHLARNGTLILKFWLNVSKDEQRKRFLSRLDEPEKNWKFASGDLVERGYWDDYMAAYQEMLNATSRPWAPWYAIPADDKPFMRLTVAHIIRKNLEQLGLSYPQPDAKELAKFEQMRSALNNE
jgi:PPK2 family polyphosphate:nucleotide phosphotransferase